MKILQFLIAFIFYSASHFASASSAPSVFIDMYYPEQSVAIEGVHMDQFERLKCRLDKNDYEVIIISHASTREKKPKQVAQMRALSVKQWMIEKMQWMPEKIYIEIRGANQIDRPIEKPLLDAFNRHVEVYIPLRSSPVKTAEQCGLVQWQKSLLEADTERALVIARSLLKKKRVNQVSLYKFTFQKKRQDLIDAFAKPNSGVVLSPEQASQVAREAVRKGNLEYARRWVLSNVMRFGKDQVSDLYLWICRSEATEDERANFVRFLFAQSLFTQDGQGLNCAIGDARSLVLTKAYLDTGSAPFITATMVVGNAHQPPILELLLANGADPKSRTPDGATLFHTMRLNTTDDVQRLLDWGLDINAIGRTFSSNPETTPLEQATWYAKPSLLDFMVQAGAEVKTQKLSSVGRNVEAQVWLLQRGMPVLDLGNELVALAAQQGPTTSPVFLELKKRGVDIDMPNVIGDTALSTAIDRYSVELVRVLVSLGANVLKPIRKRHSDRTLKSPLEQAEALREQICLPNPPYQCLNAPHLKKSKIEIIQILKDVGA